MPPVVGVHSLLGAQEYPVDLPVLAEMIGKLTCHENLGTFLFLIFLLSLLLGWVLGHNILVTAMTSL